MSTITKKELADHIAQSTQAKYGLVKVAVQNFLDEIVSELAKGNRLEFRDFGVFEVREKAARTSQNLKTLEPVDAPAKRTVKFKMGRIMKDKLSS
jgi:integration host factor subunit beta